MARPNCLVELVHCSHPCSSGASEPTVFFPDFSSHSSRFDSPTRHFNFPCQGHPSRTRDSSYSCILPIILLAAPEGLRPAYVALPGSIPDLDANPLHGSLRLRTFVPSSRRRGIGLNLTINAARNRTSGPHLALKPLRNLSLPRRGKAPPSASDQWPKAQCGRL